MTELEITKHNNRNSEHQLIWHGVCVWIYSEYLEN